MIALYIAGPMTGLPEFNTPAFNAAEAELRDCGYETRNPAQHGAGDPTATWADYMRRDIPDLLACGGVALLSGWEASRGARLEVHLAKALDMPVKPLHEWRAEAACLCGTEGTRYTLGANPECPNHGFPTTPTQPPSSGVRATASERREA